MCDSDVVMVAFRGNHVVSLSRWALKLVDDDACPFGRSLLRVYPAVEDINAKWRNS